MRSIGTKDPQTDERFGPGLPLSLLVLLLFLLVEIGLFRHGSLSLPCTRLPPLAARASRGRPSGRIPGMGACVPRRILGAFRATERTPLGHAPPGRPPAEAIRTHCAARRAPPGPAPS